MKHDESLMTLAQMEKVYIEKALLAHGNNKLLAARSLGVSLKTLYNKLHEFGLFETYQKKVLTKVEETSAEICVLPGGKA